MILQLKEKDVQLVLLSNEKEIARDAWTDENDMLEQFFPRLDKLLKYRNFCINNIEEFHLETENPTGYTTARIAQTIINTLNFSLK